VFNAGSDQKEKITTVAFMWSLLLARQRDSVDNIRKRTLASSSLSEKVIQIRVIDIKVKRVVSRKPENCCQLTTVKGREE
jgi:hypothetical protein